MSKWNLLGYFAVFALLAFGFVVFVEKQQIAEASTSLGGIVLMLLDVIRQYKRKS